MSYRKEKKTCEHISLLAKLCWPIAFKSTDSARFLFSLGFRLDVFTVCRKCRETARTAEPIVCRCEPVKKEKIAGFLSIFMMLIFTLFLFLSHYPCTVRARLRRTHSLNWRKNRTVYLNKHTHMSIEK